MKVFVCTVLMGDYDFLLPIRKFDYNKNWEYICYTDKERNIDGWNFRQLPEKVLELDVFLQTRYIKLFCQDLVSIPGIYIYIDANIYLDRGFGLLYDQFISSGRCLGLFKHPDRSNVFEEFYFALDANKLVNQERVARMQLDKYSLEKTFSNSKILFENNISFRKQGDLKVTALMNVWWSEIKDWPTRDQLSLPYVLHKSDIDYFTFSLNIREPNDFIFLHGHRENNFRDIHAYIHSRRGNFIFKMLLFTWQPIHNILVKMLKKNDQSK